MAAVAAPSPEADPVTIAFNPSLDIRFLLFLRESVPAVGYHIARQSQGK